MRATGVVGLLASLSLLPVGAALADPMLEARVGKIERMLSEQRLSDLLLQIQQLQREVQDLRGLVEEQRFLQRQGRVPVGTREPIPGLADDGLGLPVDPALDPEADFPVLVPDWSLGLDENQGTQIELDLGDSPLPALPAAESRAGGERDLYREAFEHLKARDHDAARVAFENLLAQYPRGSFADNSRYWLGEISYQEKDYPEARAAFEQLIREFPSSPRVPGAMLKLGYLDYDEQNLDQARVMLEAVVRRFPDTAEGRLAARRLADIDRASGTVR